MITEDTKNETVVETTDNTTEAPATPTEAPATPTEKLVQEETKSAISNEDILKQLLELQKGYNETVQRLNDELSKTKSELDQFKEETKSKEPIKVEAHVKGKYDFGKAAEAMGHKSIADYEKYCREVYDRINSQYSTVNKIR